MRQGLWSVFISLFVALAVMAGSAGASNSGHTFTNAHLGISSRSVASWPNTAATDKIIVLRGINDHPRNPNTPNFQARRIAAHKLGRWLTEELNALSVVQTKPVAQTKWLVQPKLYCQPSCTPTPKPSLPPNYGYGTFTYTNVHAADLYSGCDVEVDYGDDTSVCSGDYSNGNGDYEVPINPSNDDNVYLVNNNATPPPTDCLNDPSCYENSWTLTESGCIYLPDGNVSCDEHGQTVIFLRSAWFCRFLAGSGGVAAKYGGLLLKVPAPVADIIGVGVAAALIQRCGKL